MFMQNFIKPIAVVHELSKRKT